MAILSVVFGVAAFSTAALAGEPTTVTVPTLNVPIPGVDFKQYPVLRDSEGNLYLRYLEAYIGPMYNYAMGIVVLASAVMIIYGGFKYILSATATDIQDGKEKIRNALIGLVIALSSYAILNTLNPKTVVLGPLKVRSVPLEVYRDHVSHLDGVPLDEMKPWDNPNFTPPEPPSGVTPTTPPPPEPPQPGVSRAGLGTNCGKGGATLPQPKCKSFEECKTLFCDQRDYSITGVPDPKDLVGFNDFPATVGEQIEKKGLTFITPGACYKSDGCDASKYLAIQVLGPGAKQTTKWRMDGTMQFTPGARDALIKAGEQAKARGYFLVIGDGTRTMKAQAENWCQRIKDTGSPKGMATPGRSPHQLGVAVDIGLFKLESGKYKQLTLIGAICQQVPIQTSLGVENLKALEEIMAAAGYKHMCEEVWHFDYQGVYPIDCDSCEFPGKMQERTDRDKTCKK